MAEQNSPAPEAATPPRVMSWPRTTTPLEAIERSLYALADQVSGVVWEDGEDWRVVLHPRSESARPEALAHQMRQEVTDHTLRVRIAERTDPIRNLVFALAFSKRPAAPADDPSALSPDRM